MRASGRLQLMHEWTRRDEGAELCVQLMVVNVGVGRWFYAIVLGYRYRMYLCVVSFSV